jgi:hypothetical protein
MSGFDLITPSLIDRGNENVPYSLGPLASQDWLAAFTAANYSNSKFLGVVHERYAQTSLLTDTGKSLKEKLFDSAVSLKVALSKYAMHLSQKQRQKTFSEIDRLLDIEDWDEEDRLPKSASFVDFFKWIVYSKEADWTSFGLSDAGNLLAAWKIGGSLLTANFLGNGTALWTARLLDESGESHVAGSGTLSSFATTASFYLGLMRK